MAGPATAVISPSVALRFSETIRVAWKSGSQMAAAKEKAPEALARSEARMKSLPKEISMKERTSNAPAVKCGGAKVIQFPKSRIVRVVGQAKEFHISSSLSAQMDVVAEMIAQRARAKMGVQA